MMQASKGTTSSERYLAGMCRRTFLSLWSYPNLYRDQFGSKHGDGKELADLVVVFGNDIIIFSDKDVGFDDSADKSTSWRRWKKRAIVCGVRQLGGAERWIRQYPNRIFLDRSCKRRLPIHLPDPSKMTIHRVLVVKGAEAACRLHFGGSGSLMITNTEFETESEFCVNIVHPEYGFFHVLDAVAMDTVLNQLDTVSDLLEYFRKKEELFTSAKKVLVTGEEELLGLYLGSLNANNEYGFEMFAHLDGVGVQEGFWEGFTNSQQCFAQREANFISYSWDNLIEKFVHHIITETQHYATTKDVAENEILPWWMAREKRTRRRFLARKLIDMMKTAKSAHKASIVLPSDPGDPVWVFLVLPEFTSLDYQTYRETRRAGLFLQLQIVAHLYPHHHHFCGIATSSYTEGGEISEDLLYLDSSLWSAEQREEARQVYEDNAFFKQTRVSRGTERDYPVDVASAAPTVKKIGRNAPCLCGSGKKYKNCCLKRVSEFG